MGLFQSVRSKISRRMMKRRVGRHGNNHSVRLNKHYKTYHAEAQGLFDSGRHPVGHAAEPLAADLARDGFLVLPPPDGDAARADMIRSKVSGAFERSFNCYPAGKGVLRLMDGYEDLPFLTELVAERLEDVLHSYYRSFFKIFAVTVYRTVPNEAVPESSFLWHFDNAPDLQLKIMIYLSDVRADTGAFRFKSKAVSEEARKRGFWHRDDYALARPMFDDDSTTIVAEGGPGTAVVFQPGRVVHKATAPVVGHRDVAVLIVNPSKMYWRENLARQRQLLSTNAGLCIDLERDIPENIGYRF